MQTSQAMPAAYIKTIRQGFITIDCVGMQCSIPYSYSWHILNTKAASFLALASCLMRAYKQHALQACCHFKCAVSMCGQCCKAASTAAASSQGVRAQPVIPALRNKALHPPQKHAPSLLLRKWVMKDVILNDGYACMSTDKTQSRLHFSASTFAHYDGQRR